MYIGSTDGRGLTHCVIEILDNSIDEAIGGHASNLEVVFRNDGSVVIKDDGRGIPVDNVKGTSIPGVVLVLTELHAGGKFGGDGYKASGGLHGVGASAVNALSTRLDMEICRDGHSWTVSFQHGVPGHFTAAGKFTPGATVKKGKKTKSTGSTTTFWMNKEIFDPEAEFNIERIRKRLIHAVHLTSGLKATLTDEATEHTETFEAPEGIIGLVEQMAPKNTWHGPAILCTGSGQFTERASVEVDGSLVSQEVERSCNVDVVLRWSDRDEMQVESFVNTVITPRGGTHVTGSERAIVRALNGALDGTRILKANEKKPTKDDLLSGLCAIVSVQVEEPQFESQTKDALATAAVAKVVADVVSSTLKVQLESKKNKTWVRKVLEQAAEAARRRASAKAARDLVRRKSALESSSLPDKLKDCRTKGAENTELLLIEGDSAGGTVDAARDSSFQAYLPLRGKILNTWKVNDAKMLKNRECTDLVTAIGGGIGKDFELDDVRYERVIILCDADVDGSHIRALLLTFFWKYMKPLVVAGRVFAAVPPLYRITLPDRKHIYCYTDADRDEKFAELRKQGIQWKDDIQRYKGLGEMDARPLADTTLEPSMRMLRRIQPGEAEAAAEIFEVCMGSDPSLRRDLIDEHSQDINWDLLDI